MEIISRKEAKALGLTRYYTGILCIYDHNSQRSVCNTRCAECAKETNRKYQIKYKEKLNKVSSDYYYSHKERELAKAKLRYELNTETIKARVRRYHNANKDTIYKKRSEDRLNNLEEKRARDRVYSAEYRKTQESKILAKYHLALRRSSLKQRVPTWADKAQIKLLYKDCPPGREVDHIIPLQGKLVSGLHVENNLQYLSRSDNAGKSNKFTPYVQDSAGNITYIQETDV